jgi:hypothetical protein
MKKISWKNLNPKNELLNVLKWILISKSISYLVFEGF